MEPRIETIEWGQDRVVSVRWLVEFLGNRATLLGNAAMIGNADDNQLKRMQGQVRELHYLMGLLEAEQEGDE